MKMKNREVLEEELESAIKNNDSEYESGLRILLELKDDELIELIKGEEDKDEEI